MLFAISPQSLRYSFTQKIKTKSFHKVSIKGQYRTNTLLGNGHLCLFCRKPPPYQEASQDCTMVLKKVSLIDHPDHPPPPAPRSIRGA